MGLRRGRGLRRCLVKKPDVHDVASFFFFCARGWAGGIARFAAGWRARVEAAGAEAASAAEYGTALGLGFGGGW